MSRLIDADELVDTLADQIKTNESDTSASGMAAKEVLKGFIGLVNGLPTAQPERKTEEIAKDINVPSTDCISRQAAIDDLQGKDPSQIWDTADIEVWINSLPSAQPEITGKKVLAWLLAYHAKSFDLRGHYKANEVIGWLIHDISKDLLENDGGE